MRVGRQISKETRERLKKVITESPGLPNPALSKRFGISTTTIAKIKKELKEEQQNG